MSKIPTPLQKKGPITGVVRQIYSTSPVRLSTPSTVARPLSVLEMPISIHLGLRTVTVYCSADRSGCPQDPPGLDKGEWQGARMSPDFCGLVGWLLKKDPLRRPTWPQLLAHPFWGNCQTPVPLEMPAQPRFDRALAVVASAASAALKTRLPGQGNGRNLSACASRERGWSEKHDPGVGKKFRVEGDQSSTLAILNTNTQEEHSGERRGGTLDHADEEGISRKQDQTLQVGVEGDAAAPHGASANQAAHQPAALSGRGSPVRGKPPGDAESGGTERVGQHVGGQRGGGRGSSPRSNQARTEPESRSSAVDAGMENVTKGQEGDGEDGNLRGAEKGGGKHVNMQAMNEDTSSANATMRRHAQEDLKSTAQGGVDGGEGSRAPIHGYGNGYGSGIREATAGGMINIGAGGGGGRARGGAGDCDDAVKRAAALDSLRLRGKIPPIPPEGRASLSASASGSSSVGEQYGSSFEEDTEGSSSYSVGAGSSEGPGIDAPGALAAVAMPSAPRTPEVGSSSSSMRRYNRSSGKQGIRLDKSGTFSAAAISGTASAGTESRAHPVTPPPRRSRQRTTREVTATALSSSPGSSSASRLEIASPVANGGGSGSSSGSGLGSGSCDITSKGLSAMSSQRGASSSSQQVYLSSRTLSLNGWSARVGAEIGQWRGGTGAGVGDLGGDDGSGGRSGSCGSTDAQQQRRLAPSSQAGRAEGGTAQIEVGRDGSESGANSAGASVDGKNIDRRCSPAKEEGTREGRRAALRSVGGVQRREGHGGNSYLAADGGVTDEAVVVDAHANGSSDDSWVNLQGIQELLLHSSDAQVSPSTLIYQCNGAGVQPTWKHIILLYFH